MSDWISWIKAQSADLVDSVKQETVVLSGSLVESVKDFADKASKAVESLAKDDDSNVEEAGSLERDQKKTDVSLIEKLDLMAANTEDYIDSLASDMTTKIGDFLSKAITIIPDTPEITLVSDRRSNLLLEMQKNADTYATDYSFVEDESVVNRFKHFSQEFTVKDHLEEIDYLLEEIGAISDFYRKMVPHPLDYDTFWLRYFFQVSEIDFQENARSMALKDALENEGDVIWDDSDEDLPNEVVIKSMDEDESFLDRNDSINEVEAHRDSKEKAENEGVSEGIADTENSNNAIEPDGTDESVDIIGEAREKSHEESEVNDGVYVSNNILEEDIEEKEDDEMPAEKSHLSSINGKSSKEESGLDLELNQDSDIVSVSNNILEEDIAEKEDDEMPAEKSHLSSIKEKSSKEESEDNDIVPISSEISAGFEEKPGKEDDEIPAEISGTESKTHLSSFEGTSSPNLEGSFDIIRKESVQPLQVYIKEKNLTSDDDWGGWDDSPDSPAEKNQ